ncbi:hypothetical protein AU476_15105 [Cupriavidus sp. UYMSc13B]|nr:hypothetical protein AU476_15105 [Cupriavidus sp. UYMSc13B]
MRDNMETIRTLTDSADLAGKAANIAAVTSRYESAFLRVVDLYGQLGRADSGFEGQFRNRAHAIEVLLGAGSPERLLTDLLWLRRAEKDFIMRGQRRNVEAFGLAIARFRQHITTSGLPAERRRELLHLANDYGGQFDAYVAIKSEIEAGTLAYLSEVHAVEPMLDQLYRHAHQALEITRVKLRSLNLETARTVVGASLAALLFGLGISVLIAHNISRSVRACADFAALIAGGVFSSRLPSAGPNEFGVLVTGLNQMADSLQESRRLEEERLVELGRLNRTLRMLSQCNYSLVRATSEAELLATVCQQVVEIGGYQLAWVGLAMHDEARSIHPAAVAGIAFSDVSALGLSWGDGENRHGVAGRAIRESRPVVVCNLRGGPLHETWREEAISRGLFSCIALPLLIKSEVVGALNIYAAEAGDFDVEEVRLLQELADDLAFGMAGLRESAARTQAEQDLDYHANYDLVTGLANRNLLHDRLGQATIHAARSDGLVAVLLLGLDRFKAINESLGHAAGDAVLKHVARCLAACLREGDTLARLAGDEFVVVMGDIGRTEDLASVARQLLEAVGRQAVKLDSGEVLTSASLGISLYPKDGIDVGSLLQNAEAAMHSGKSLGGNTFRFYAPEMNERISARLALEVDLRRALERGELLVHYQPR